MLSAWNRRPSYVYSRGAHSGCHNVRGSRKRYGSASVVDEESKVLVKAIRILISRTICVRNRRVDNIPGGNHHIELRYSSEIRKEDHRFYIVLRVRVSPIAGIENRFFAAIQVWIGVCINYSEVIAG